MKYYDKLIENGFKFDKAVEDYRGGGYIMNDGMFLSINKNEDFLKNQTPSKSVHCRFDMYLLNEVECPSDLSVPRVRLLKITEDNAVVINDGSNFDWERPYIDLPEIEPTNEQYTSILSFLDKLAYAQKKDVHVGICYSITKSESYKIFNLETSLPEDIIKTIKSWYTKLKEN